jgi:hypothetical protein
MNNIAQFENSASRSRSKHEGESSTALCDRLSRTRDTSQRQLPTDQDYAVPTREYQTDQSSLKPAPAAAGPVLDQRQKQRQQQKQPHSDAEVDRVTPYQSGWSYLISRSTNWIGRWQVWSANIKMRFSAWRRYLGWACMLRNRLLSKLVPRPPHSLPQRGFSHGPTSAPARRKMLESTTVTDR